MTRRALALLALLLLAAVVTPGGAFGASRSKIVKDCASDGVINGTYTAGDLRDARQNLPSDVEEYTDCLDALRRAELALRAQPTPAAPGAPAATPVPQRGTPDNVDPADLPNPTDTGNLNAARVAGQQPVAVGNVQIVPAAGVRVDRSDVPSALIAAVAVLAAAGACLIAPGLRRRLVRRRR